MPREILIHLNVAVPDDDLRGADEIVAAVTGALEVGSDDAAVANLEVVVAMAEEI